ncbi:uncharacterized protein LOC104889002 [Beta vulgaris subsp. vulgaris]|uniref:uncharacterized protein LOC104889002 n=1 Tax=Beta vulgaris subsp. vulgaris TaxID=3555 RepID=UPI002036A962|nr:uncharacterized protein LOC104889002 [Beta vulgaris subsp. vulgaris]
MVDTEQKMRKKATITEEDVCTLLQRYSATTVLAVLKEMAQFVGAKIDWQALVKKTETGIKSAREFQMLWRHLAYRQPLIENIGPEDQPLDDDSDLEYEVEACPSVSPADAMEACNCVQALVAGPANKSRMPNSSSIEVPKVSSGNPQAQKRSQVAGTFDRLDTNGSTSNNQKKRKSCLEGEDQEPIATVRKAELKGERNTTQRAQRANTIRKKQGSSNIGAANTAGSQLSEAQLATRYALGMALKDGPPTVVGNGQADPNNAVKTSASKRNLPIIKATMPPSQPQSCPVSTAAPSVKNAPMGSSSKICSQRKAPPQINVSADSIQAAAVAAGGRIASPSDVASLHKVFKAAKSKDASHMRGGAPLVKTSAAGSSSALPPNVHLICTGLNTKPTSVAAGTASHAAGGQQAKGSAVGPYVLPASQLPKVRATSAVAIERTSVQQMENRTQTAVNVQGSDVKSIIEISEDDASSAGAPFGKCQATSPGADVGISKLTKNVGDSQCTMNGDVAENEGSKDDTCKQVVENLVPNKGNKPTCFQRKSIPCVKETHEASATAVVVKEAGKMAIPSEGLAGAEISGQMKL